MDKNEKSGGLKKITADKMCKLVVRGRYVIMGVFAVLLAVSIFLIPKVQSNYDITKYLPKDMETSQALTVVEKEFGLSSTVNVMVKGIDKTEAAALAKKLKVRYVSMVSFDPSSAAHFKDNCALIKLTVDGGDYSDNTAAVVSEVTSIVESRGYNFYMNGSGVSGTQMQSGIGGEMTMIMVIAIAVVLAILLLTSRSWFEPIVFLIVLGVAIAINLGTNFFLGEISYITKSIAAILQLALAMDYSIVLLHAFEKRTDEGLSPRRAAAEALRGSVRPILCSSLTTVAGLIALVFMSFTIGRDIGFVMSKGILISMLTVFLLMPGLLVLLAKPLAKFKHKPLPLGGAGISRAVIKTRFVVPIIMVALIVTGAVLSSFNTYSFSEHQTTIDNSIQETFGYDSTMMVLVPKVKGSEDIFKQNVAADKISRLNFGGKQAMKSVITYELALAAAGGESAPQIVKEKLDLTFNGDNYSRMLITFDLGRGVGEDTYEFLRGLRAVLDEVYGEGTTLIAGNEMSSYDIATSFNSDLIKTSLITIIAILLIIGIAFRAVLLPALLVMVIQGAIWISMSFSFLAGTPIFFMSYIIASAILMGATIDYGILITNNYLHARQRLSRDESIREAIGGALPTILTSGLILAIAGFIIGGISTSTAISTIGILIGSGASITLLLITVLLPQLLYLFDKPILKTTFGFRPKKVIKEGKAEEASGLDN